MKRRRLGKLKTIVADHGRIADPKEKRDQRRLQKKLAGGGSLYDIGIYSLNAARYLTGEEPAEISAQIFSMPNDPRFREVEENVNFTLKFPSGVIASCTSSYGYSETKCYRVFSDKVWLELDPATDYYKHRMTIGRKNEQANEENKVINSSLESLEGFMIRKLKAVERIYILEKKVPTRNQLIYRAVIVNKTSKNSPKIQKEINETLERIIQRVK